jgi:hypothetical protein
MRGEVEMKLYVRGRDSEGHIQDREVSDDE